MAVTIQDNPQAERIRALAKSLREMGVMLQKQRDILAGRNVLVSEGPADEMTALSDALTRLASGLANDTVELSQLRELAKTTDVITSAQNLDTILNNVLDTCILLTGAERGYIMLQSDSDAELKSGGALELRSARNLSAETILSGQVIDGREDATLVISRTLVNRVAESGDLLVTTNAEQDTRFTGSDSIVTYALRSILCVPLKRRGTVIGVLYLDNRIRPGIFGGREQRLITAFANQSAIAIDNARLFERVRNSLSEVTAIRDYMESIFASIASGVVATDEDDRITQMNEAAARILNLDQRSSIGQLLWSVLPPLFAGFRAMYGHVLVSDIKRVIEADALIEGRGQVSLNIQLAPLKDSNDVTRGVTMVLDDLTEIKELRAQMSAVRRYLPPALIDNIQEIDQLELSGVERDISLVGCDVRGFSTFSEAVPPEEVMSVINQFLSASTEAIHHYEGIIDKYIGDAAVGIFNSQLNPQQDHTLRAVYAAMRMVENVYALHQHLPEESRLLYGIGVHTGRAILGNVGSPRRKEFTVIGDVLSVTKIIQDVTPGGEVYLSEAAYQAVREYVEVEPAQPRPGKEYMIDMPLYRVIRLVNE